MEGKINKKDKPKAKKKRRNLSSLMSISFLPSIFTLLNLLFGFLALIQIINGKYKIAVYLVVASMLMDAFDGTIARMTKTESNFGIQLDSLVDAISFGLVTSLLIYNWAFKTNYNSIGKIIAFFFLSAGVIRLARFNVFKEVKEVPSNVFVGLPIPSAALSISSFVLVFRNYSDNKIIITIFGIFSVIVSYMMISNIKYKTIKNLKLKNSLFLLLLLAFGVSLLIVFPLYTIPFVSIIFLFNPIIFPLIEKAISRRGRKKTKTKKTKSDSP